MHVLRSLFFSFALLVMAGPAFAQTSGGGGSQTPTPTAAQGGLQNPLGKINSLPAFMNAILDAVVQLGTIILTLALVYVGFKFVTAQGSEEKLSSAKSALMWTVIGGLILLGAKAIGLVIEGTVNSLR